MRSWTHKSTTPSIVKPVVCGTAADHRRRLPYNSINSINSINNIRRWLENYRCHGRTQRVWESVCLRVIGLEETVHLHVQITFGGSETNQRLVISHGKTTYFWAPHTGTGASILTHSHSWRWGIMIASHGTTARPGKMTSRELQHITNSHEVLNP